MQWRATCSQVGNHTPGRVFIWPISRSSIAMRSARPDWNGCMQTLRYPPTLYCWRNAAHQMSPTRSGSVMRCADASAEPVEVEVHRVVDDVVHRQVQKAIATTLVVLVVRPLVGCALGAVNKPVLPE